MFIQSDGEDLRFFLVVNTFKAIANALNFLNFTCVDQFCYGNRFRNVSDRFAIQGHRISCGEPRNFTPLVARPAFIESVVIL